MFYSRVGLSAIVSMPWLAFKSLHVLFPGRAYSFLYKLSVTGERVSTEYGLTFG